ncbi:MAG: hypothetical protein PHZ03_06125 [Syntrophomonas sp.]|nr:hypothetical protein [Syntrophomonas sp.]
MQKFICVILMIGLFSLAGCQAGTSRSNMIKDINGVSMVSAKEVSSLLGLTYSIEDGCIVLRQDRIILKFDFTTPYVYKDGYIMYIMKKPAVDEDGIAYLPLSFFLDYFKVEIKSDEKNQLFIANSGVFSLYEIVKFLPEDVMEAINNKNYPNRDKILKAVELPRSMDIRIPKINNWYKVIETKPLDAFTYDFKGDLRQHGYSEKELAMFSYNDYTVIESTWKLPEEMIKSVKLRYKELENRDLSDWTYGDYQKYYTVQDEANFESSFTEEQKTQLKQRGILLEDLHYLFKEFYNIDTILAKPDEVLKKTIEGYYQFSIDML